MAAEVLQPMDAAAGQDLRVHVMLPTTRDNERTRAALLAAGFSCAVHDELRSLCRAIAQGAGVALLTEEALTGDRAGQLMRTIRDQPPWSDFPLVVLTRDRAGDAVGVSYRQAMNVMLVERPIRIRSLLSALEVALRSRRRQYEIRDYLAELARRAEAVRENDERLQFALMAGRLGSWELHVDTMALESSPLCRQSLGQPAERPLSVDELFAAIHPQDRARVRRLARRAITGRGPLEAEFRTVWPDGTTHWLLARGRATDGADGRGTRMAGITLDVTDRRRDEQALREADRKKDDFLALLAHELRNPLAPIRNGLEIVRRSSDETLRERSYDVMARQLAHMVRLIDDLLDVSRINRNKIELRLAPIDLSDAIRAALETAGPLIEAAGHQLVVELPDAPVRLDADLTRLAQVFSNLLTNSAKYTARGGTIRLTAEREGDWVRVSVSDDGIGIPADSLARIFDMFSQVDSSLERSTGGLGIGLAVVKGLVELHGGTVSAASAGRGHGSEFTVRLPLRTSHPAIPPDAAARSPAATAVKHRILVVDDNRDSAESLAAVLRLFGNDVELAHDGEEAVRKAEALLPEIILMDVAMPRLNGLEATRRIRSQAWGHDIRVVAVTGWGQETDRERTAAAGCDGHLVKPVDLEELTGLLAELGGAAP